MSAAAIQETTDTLRDEAKEVVDGLSLERLRSARDFLRWLEQLEDEAEVEMLSRSKKFRDEMEAASRAADAAPKVDWRTLRDDV